MTFNERFECKNDGTLYQEPEPRLFSFNNPYGACPRCQGFGNTIDFDLNLVVPDPANRWMTARSSRGLKPRYRVANAGSAQVCEGARDSNRCAVAATHRRAAGG